MISPERSCELLRTYTATRCGTAFQELVAGWTGLVYATALRIASGQEALAEDTTQTVFSRLAAAPEKVKDSRALGAWLHAAATGVTLDALRHEARRRRREVASQHPSMMETPDLLARDVMEYDEDLTPEIDSALSKLPPQDSQLLIMRFWQQQDWRSIGRALGLSDDTAQKRMSRSLERLRRMLAQRGINSTAGTLSAVLVATVPGELPAATALNIISAAQASITATTTALTATVMTTKTKLAIAAAVVIGATAPILYQQQRIADLEEEQRRAKQQSSIRAFTKVPATPLFKIGNSANVDSARPKEFSNIVAPQAPSSSMTESDIPVDFAALSRGQKKEKLAVLGKRLSLTPEQEARISQALEYGQDKMVVSPPNVLVTKATPEDVKRMDDAISSSLTEKQQEEYKAFRAEEKANALEAVANRELSRLQSLTTLTQEQKDQAFAAFSQIASRESMLPVMDPDEEADAIKESVAARWADRQDALREILTPEQMAIFQQAGNPFGRGTGG